MKNIAQIDSMNILAVFVILLNGVLAGPPYRNADAVVFLDSNDPLPWTEMDFNRSPPLYPAPYYSSQEIRCFEDRQIYQMGKCWNLLDRGPCNEGEWLILDPSAQGIKSQCAKKPCSTDKVLWPVTQECISSRDRTKCTKKDTSLQVNSLGYAACKCVFGASRVMARNGACYQLYSKGFCDVGYVVAKDPDDVENPAICVPDKCNTTLSDTLILPYKDGCYPEGSSKPCPEDQMLSVDVNTGKPSCSYNIITWHLVEPPPRCSEVDFNGDCRDKAAVKLEVNNFISDLKSDRIKHKNKFNLSKG